MDLITALLRPEAYPHPVTEIKLIQTHISWVFLTGKWVYKVKKPVNFGFLDFTTLEKRHHFCEEELRLNRRLSPDIYLKVVPIVQKDGHFYVDHPGKPIEYAVKMKQLPEVSCLSYLIEKNQVTSSIVDNLAQVMANFYQKAITNPEIASYGTPAKVMVNVKENFEQTEPFVDKTIDQEIYEALKDYSYDFLNTKQDVFFERINEGKIKDGHGDFHCANVYWYQNKIYVLDCIEFNERFRYGDVASDVAFLLMDLDFRKATFWGNWFLNTFLAYSNDFGLLKVNKFYKIYRAYVRGKIASFESQMPEIPETQRQAAVKKARSYFELAHSYLNTARKPFILATTGFLGSGKSVLATNLGATISAIVIRSDALRKHLAGIDLDKHVYVPFGQGIYSSEMTQRVYDKAFKLAEQAISCGYPVIIDATFSKREVRKHLKELADKLNCPCLFLYCECPENELKRRLIQRQSQKDASDGHLEILDAFKASYQPPERDEEFITINTTDDVKHLCTQAQRVLQGKGLV